MAMFCRSVLLGRDNQADFVWRNAVAAEIFIRLVNLSGSLQPTTRTLQTINRDNNNSDMPGEFYRTASESSFL